MSVTRSHLWPDPLQRRLLDAALGEGDAAIAAFAGWYPQIDFSGHLDQASFRLLPLVYHNLRANGFAGEGMQRLASVYRYHWVQLQKIHADAARLIALFASAGIPVMVNKGLALGIDYYPDPGQRPMSDVDLAVPRERAAEAAELLQREGWRICHAGRAKVHWRDIVRYRHSVGFVDARGHEMDLHWAPSIELRGPAIEEAFWRDAVPIDVRGQPAVRASATCTLLHTALHGVRYNEMPPLRWIADFAMVLRKDEGAIDWAQMGALACASGNGVRLGIALRWLRDEMGMAIPDSVVDALAAVRPGLAERIVNYSALTDPNRSMLHRLLSDRRVSMVASLAASGQMRAVPGMGLRWISREIGHMRRTARAR